MPPRLTGDQIVATFPRPDRPAGRPWLVVMAGLPVSGKSTFARRLSAGRPIAHVSTDVLRLGLTGGRPVFDRRENHLTHATAARLVAVLLDEGHTVIADATNLVREDRRRLVGLARERRVGVAIVWCEVSSAVAAERLEARAVRLDPDDRSHADAAVRDRMATRATRPDPSEADGVLLVVDEASAEAAFAALHDLLDGA